MGTITSRVIKSRGTMVISRVMRSRISGTRNYKYR